MYLRLWIKCREGGSESIKVMIEAVNLIAGRGNPQLARFLSMKVFYKDGKSRYRHEVVGGIRMSRETATKWLKQAQHDLRMAERNIGIKGYDVAAFLAHQAIEKLLKCILIINGKDVPKTHKLDRLAQLLTLPPNIADRILDLTEDYTLSRYPDVSPVLPYLQYNLKTARAKVKIAKDIFNALKGDYADLEG
jgi:HEPN domain-containing protein